MSYLERYKAGEHVQVWREMMPKYWKDVQKEPFHADALAVARETMARVRQNVATLIMRLPAIGYEFGYDYWIASEYAQEREWAQSAQQASPLRSEPLSDIKSRLEKIEQAVGALPLSLQAWHEVIGSVNFVGQPPAAWEDAIDSLTTGSLCMIDPLFVDPLDDDSVQRCIEEKEVAFAPDEYHKYNTSGGEPYHIKLRCPTVDSVIAGVWLHTNFVDYLRVALSWGGFPGLARLPKRPDKDIAYLTADLLPF